MRCSARRRPKASLPLARWTLPRRKARDGNPAGGYSHSMNRILLIAAVVCFALAALSAFSDDINVNELGFLALGLALWAGAPLVATVPLSAGRRRYARR